MPRAPERIDAHAHVFLRSLPMAQGRRYTPSADAPLAAYLRHLDAHGLTRGVLVQPSFLGTDNSHLLDCLAAARGRLAGIAVLAPDTPDEEFDRFDAAGVVGARLNWIDGDAPDLAATVWRAFLGRVAARGWQIELQRRAGESLEIARIVLDAGVPLALDHFALPDPSLGAADPDWRALLSLGRTGRLWVKLSGAYRNGPGVARACYPVLRDALGVDRLMWGSDWPHTRFEASESFGAARAFLGELVPDPVERDRLLAAPGALFGFV